MGLCWFAVDWDFHDCPSISRSYFNSDSEHLRYCKIQIFWSCAKELTRLKNKICVFGIFVCLFICLFLRQDLPMWPWLAGSSPQIPGWPQILRQCSCHCLLGVRLALSLPVEETWFIKIHSSSWSCIKTSWCSLFHETCPGYHGMVSVPSTTEPALTTTEPALPTTKPALSTNQSFALSFCWVKPHFHLPYFMKTLCIIRHDFHQLWAEWHLPRSSHGPCHPSIQRCRTETNRFGSQTGWLIDNLECRGPNKLGNPCGVSVKWKARLRRIRRGSYWSGRVWQEQWPMAHSRLVQGCKM